MDSFEQVLPRLVKIPIFAAFNPENEEDKRILKIVYENLSELRVARAITSPAGV